MKINSPRHRSFTARMSPVANRRYISLRLSPDIRQASGIGAAAASMKDAPPFETRSLNFCHTHRDIPLYTKLLLAIAGYSVYPSEAARSVDGPVERRDAFFS